jgi:hypothetical protein
MRRRSKYYRYNPQTKKMEEVPAKDTIQLMPSQFQFTGVDFKEQVQKMICPNPVNKLEQ